MKKRLTRVGLMLAVLALVAAACSNTDDADDTTTTAGGDTTTTTAAETTTTAGDTTTTTTGDTGGEVAFDVGVTAEPCPDGNPDRGCIYLGVLYDLTGPFQAPSPALLAAQRAFWAAANAEGGIGGQYDVHIPDSAVRDTEYNPELFVQRYNDISSEIAAVSMSLGTSQSIAALPDMARDNTVAAPMTWWSGWAFDELDNGLVVEFGTNYCFEAMNAFDWSMTALPAAPTTVGILAIPNDYGMDYAAGVKAAAEANGVEVAWEAPVIPVSAGGDPTQIEAVQQVLANPVDVVYLVTGPTETGAIVGGAASQGATNIWIGAAPSWNVGLLSSAAAPVFEAGVYYQSSFVGPWGSDTVGHEKMRATLTAAGVETPSDFFVSGWVSQYGLKATLEQALSNGDLTKAGIAAAAGQLESVDYEGMMPPRAFGGDPNTQFPREGLVSGIDTSAPTGTVVLQDFYVGPTAEAYDFTTACTEG